MTRKALRDPLVHFLLAGAAIWAVLALVGNPVDPAERSIVLSREQQAALSLQFERTIGRSPTDAELDAQIERWEREEVLYREALRLGLDEGDVVVRRRLATKMDELAGAQAEMAEPTETKLREWHREHAGEFETGEVLTFEQIYFTSEVAAKAAVGQNIPRGEQISLARSVVRMSGEDVVRLFGSPFAEELASLEVTPRWQGPVRSGYGWHLVRLTLHEDGVRPSFDDVREQVERDWRSRTMQARREKAYQLLRDAYKIEIE